MPLEITPEGMPREENSEGRAYLGTGALFLGESPHLTYRICRATDEVLEEIEATENLFKLREFPPPEPITRRGITTFNEIRSGEYLFKLTAPIKVEAESSTDGWIIYYEELSILAVAPTMEECIDEFEEYFSVLWEKYASKKEDELTDSGQALKHKLLDIVRV